MQLDREGLRLGQDQPRQDSQEGPLGRDGNRVKAGVIKAGSPAEKEHSNTGNSKNSGLDERMRLKCLWDRKKSSTTVNEGKSIRGDFREVIRGLVRR